MPGGQAHHLERIRRSLSLAPPIIALSVGVVLPVLLSTATGIVAIVTGESSATLILGILVVSFTAAAIGGAVILYVLLGRRARLARLQSDLLANVTHELRTPLAAIRLHAQTLQGGLLAGDPGRAATSLETIVRETEWLEAMVDRLLSWRAASRDRDLPRLESAPLAPVVEETVARFRRMVPADEVDLRCSLAPAGAVRHDPQVLGQALLNLLVNAYKYTPAPRRVSVELREEAGRALLAVADNGIGIPARELRRVFEPFHRGGEAARRSAGAGLGLAVVQHAVRLHGGWISATSRVGEGSRFVISLPLATAPGGGR